MSQLRNSYMNNLQIDMLTARLDRMESNNSRFTRENRILKIVNGALIICTFALLSIGVRPGGRMSAAQGKADVAPAEAPPKQAPLPASPDFVPINPRVETKVIEME